MVSKLLFMILSGFLVILLLPSEYKSYCRHFSIFFISLAIIYSLLLAKKFNFYSGDYQFIQHVDFYLGLNLFSLFIVVFVTISSIVYIFFHWKNIDNKACILYLLSLELLLVFVFSCIFL